MKKKTEEILMSHFKEHFGKMIAEMLLEQKIKDFKITSFEDLSMIEKIDFGKSMINDIFKKFYNDDKIKNMHILYLLRFSINEAIEKIEKMIKKDANVELAALTNINLDLINDTVVKLEDEKNVNIGFEVSNILDGVMIVTIEKESAIKFGIMMLQILQGEKSQDYELDDMKVSAIYEFFNILIPSFTEVLGNIYDADIFYVPLRYEEFKKKYFEGEKIKVPQQLLETELKIKIAGVKTDGLISFFINKTGDKFNDLVKSASKNASDPWENDPPKINVSKSGNILHDLTNMFKMLNIEPKKIQKILDDINKTDLKFDITDMIAFHKNMIDNYLTNPSEHKIDSIRANLAFLFGVKDN